jgi:DNA-binding response OmpR family regulator
MADRIPRVTVVNDSPEFLRLVRRVLERDRFNVHTLAGERATLEQMIATDPDLLIVDIRAGEANSMAGWQLILEARRSPQLARVPVIICTADVGFVRQQDAAIRALDAAVLAKPFPLADLEAAVAASLASAPADSELPSDAPG